MSEGEQRRRVVPVILSGGAGTRLWPLSRRVRPKQLLALAGDSTMLAQTLTRVGDRRRFDVPIVVAGRDHADAVAEQLDGAHLIVEPSARNTAPAATLAALAAPDAMLLVMPSDHLVRDAGAFRAAVDRALPLAEQGWLVTFAVRPDRAETGYGYIQRGEPLAEGVFRAARFVEKPDAERAARMIAAGDHDWNSGLFLFRADVWLDAVKRHAPGILPAVRDAVGSGGRAGPEPTAFARSPSISIDHAVMEKADRIATVPVEMGWSDVGSWDALHAIGTADATGNVAAGDVVLIDSADCLVRSDGPAVVTIGVEDLIVVAAGDAVLVMRRGESQRVREAVETLRARRHPTMED